MESKNEVNELNEYERIIAVVKKQIPVLLLILLIAFPIHELSHLTMYWLYGATDLKVVFLMEPEMMFYATCAGGYLTTPQYYVSVFAGGLFTSIILSPFLYKKQLAGIVPLMQLVYAFFELYMATLVKATGIAMMYMTELIVVPLVVVMFVMNMVYAIWWSYYNGFL